MFRSTAAPASTDAAPIPKTRPTAAPTTTTTAAPTTTTTAPPPPPPSAPAAPTGSGFEILDPSQVTSLEEGETEADRGASVLVEHGPVTLGANLVVARADSTQREVEDASQVTITAGTTVCPYYIHFDVARGIRQSATVTFDSEILGHTDGSVDQLDNTSEFELSGIDYAPDGGAGAGRDDILWITGTTAHFDFKANANNRNDVRFLLLAVNA